MRAPLLLREVVSAWAEARGPLSEKQWGRQDMGTYLNDTWELMCEKGVK